MESVRKLEELMHSNGIDAGISDGVFDDALILALIEFQRTNDLSAHGQLSVETLEALGLTVKNVD